MAQSQEFGSAGASSEYTVSTTQYVVGGIQVTIYGLSELDASRRDNLACIWLLHQRGRTREAMSPLATDLIQSWNALPQSATKGLIAASFDQRNHGTRLAHESANKTWRDGNPTHALDLYSIYSGTADDVGMLIEYIDLYVFGNETTIRRHSVLGVSLGGHAAWQCVTRIHSRVDEAVVVVGCPDYLRLMTQRAVKMELSRLEPSLESDKFRQIVAAADPAARLFDSIDPERVVASRKLAADLFRGTRIMCLSGGADTLVPYTCSQRVVTWLKSMLEDDGWLRNEHVVLEDVVELAAGHEFTPKMQAEAKRFLFEGLSSVKGTMHELSYYDTQTSKATTKIL